MDSLVRRAHVRFLPIFRIVPRGFRWVSPLRGSPGTKKIRAESSSNGSEIAECRVLSAQNLHAELPACPE